MEATGNEKSFDLEQLMEFSKALKDYKNTGVKQCLSILQSLLESNTTLNQLKESKLGATLSKIAKEEFTEPEEKQIKEEAIKVFKRCKAREAANPLPAAPVADGEKAAEKPASNGNKPAEREEKKPVEERKEERPRKEDERPRKEEERPRKEEERRVRDEERPRKEEERPRKEERPSASDVFGSADSDVVPKRNNNVPPKREPAREHAREPERKKESVGKGTPSGGVPFLPNLEPQYRNFSLKSFSEGLLMDYKTNPAEKEKMRPTAYKKAVEIERALMEKVRGNENEYRLLARDLSTFLMMKTNLELRNYIMVNDGDCKEFVNNKENFMNTAAREKIEKTSRRLIDAANADYDKKTIRESALYQCKNCKSKRITKTEKQTRSGDEPMTSFFQCVDCGKGWKEG